jgi:hypothetical protein
MKMFASMNLLMGGVQMRNVLPLYTVQGTGNPDIAIQ